MSSCATLYAPKDIASPAVSREATFVKCKSVGVRRNIQFWSFNLDDTFNLLKDEWIRETALYSDPSQIMNNKAYQSILQMGGIVVPLILQDMLNNDNLWFSALFELTGEDPIDPEHYGDISAMKNDWILWGIRNGII